MFTPIVLAIKRAWKALEDWGGEDCWRQANLPLLSDTPRAFGGEEPFHDLASVSSNPFARSLCLVAEEVCLAQHQIMSCRDIDRSLYGTAFFQWHEKVAALHGHLKSVKSKRYVHMAHCLDLEYSRERNENYPYLSIAEFLYDPRRFTRTSPQLILGMLTPPLNNAELKIDVPGTSSWPLLRHGDYEYIKHWAAKPLTPKALSSGETLTVTMSLTFD